jgi:hypothetical protein
MCKGQKRAHMPPMRPSGFTIPSYTSAPCQRPKDGGDAEEAAKPPDKAALFHEIEVSFEGFVSGLIGEGALHRFGRDLEGLRLALIQSREHNAVLFGKCEQLNREIVANARALAFESAHDREPPE